MVQQPSRNGGGSGEPRHWTGLILAKTFVYATKARYRCFHGFVHCEKVLSRVLARYGLAEIPEAHCYLMHDGVRVDITRDITSRIEAIAGLLYEEQIAPPQVGLYKVNMQQEFRQNWLQTMELGKSLTCDELWRIREECIGALAAPL